MKTVLALAILALTVSAAPVDEDATHVSGDGGWFYPSIDGTWKWITLEAGEALLREEEAAHQNKARLSLNPVSFYLYTKSNPTEPQKITATESSISSSNFNAANPTRFIIHGWVAGYEVQMNADIRDAWLSRGDYNIIVIDWARARSVDYASSVVAIPAVGAKIANLIDFLHENHGLSLDTLVVIGHSLGAHVAGFTGKNVKGGQVHSIVGLDPALPLFSYDKPDKRLNSNDAWYVESIQTDGGLLGFLKPIGKGAFYPNGGRSQPGCNDDLSGSCSHGRSTIYYAEAVRKNDFPTVKCADYEDAVAKSCGSTYSSVRMGAITNAYMVAGDYYVPVNSEAPFGKGE